MHGNDSVNPDSADSGNVELVRSLMRSMFQEAMAPFQPTNIDPWKGLNYYDTVERFEKLLIETTLAITAGSQVKAAKLLEISPTTLNSKIKRFKIPINGMFL